MFQSEEQFTRGSLACVPGRRHLSHAGQHATCSFYCRSDKHDIFRSCTIYWSTYFHVFWKIISPSYLAMPSFADLPTEIEIYLLWFLADNKKALFSTIRVSQAWHRYTVDLLWRHSSANNLANVEEPRRQHYANRLVKLEVTKLWYYYQFRFLSFPDLVEVSLGKNKSPKDDRLLGTVWIIPYLQPSLRKLCLTGSFF